VEMLINDFNERFHDLKPFLVDLNSFRRFICSIRAVPTGITWVTTRWIRKDSLQDQRKHDVAVREMWEEIPSLEYFGKAKSNKISVILFGRM